MAYLAPIQLGLILPDLFLLKEFKVDLLDNLVLALSLNFLKYRMTPGFTPGSTDDVWKRRNVVGI